MNLKQVHRPWPELGLEWPARGEAWKLGAKTGTGVNILTREPVVGVGSVCRRQDTADAERLMVELYRVGILPHGFKKDGLAHAGRPRWRYSGGTGVRRTIISR